MEDVARLTLQTEVQEIIQEIRPSIEEVQIALTVLLRILEQEQIRIETLNRLQEPTPTEEVFSLPQEPIPIETFGQQLEPDLTTLAREGVVAIQEGVETIFLHQVQGAIQITVHLRVLTLHRPQP